MVDVTVASDRVVFEIEGWDKRWSLHCRLEMPLAHITGEMRGGSVPAH